MPADIIVYALIAAGLIFWLRNILGTRNGEERDRPNPYARAAEKAVEAKNDPDDTFSASEESETPQDRIADLAENPTATLSVENKTAELGLIDIANADRNFEISTFLNAAQDAFVYVVEAFAEGDRETLKGLLAPVVYDAFESAIQEREEAEESMEMEIQAVRKSQVVEARLENKRKAFVTVYFVADEITVTKDKDGEIISGHDEKVTEMIDIWTFTRDIKSRDPRWLVCETRSDDPDDNEKIPDTH